MASSPLVNTCVDILKCNYSKRTYGAIKYQKNTDLNLNSYLKQLDPMPFVNSSDLYSIHSHRYLPLFFIGGKSNIDVYSFSTAKNFNKINCRELSEIVKINTNFKNDLIGAIDSDGSLLSLHFDPSYNCPQSLFVKKNHIVDFCYLNSNLIASGSKDGSINVYDPLLHPQRNTIFK